MDKTLDELSAQYAEQGPSPAPVYDQDQFEQTDTWLMRMGRNKKVLAGIVAGAVLVGSGVTIASCNGGGEETPAAEEAQPTGDQFEANEVCPETWEMPGVNHGEQNRWFDQGITEIAHATDDKQAEDAAFAWINGSEEHLGIKHDSQLLLTSYNIFKTEAMPALTAEELVDEKGCATPKAEEATINLRAVVAVSDVTAEDAPENGYNTGTDAEGNVTISSTAGVGGNRKAIKIVTPDGKVVYVMARCGQPVLPGQPGPELPIPVGPTDEIPLMKTDDGRLPGNPNVPADQDHGTPDIPGQGPAGQTPDAEGYVPGERRPQVPTTQSPNTTQPEEVLPPATTSPQPTNTLPPVTATTTVDTTAPQNQPRPPKP